MRCNHRKFHFGERFHGEDQIDLISLRSYVINRRNYFAGIERFRCTSLGVGVLDARLQQYNR